jgi:hypothetical protein
VKKKIAPLVVVAAFLIPVTPGYAEPAHPVGTAVENVESVLDVLRKVATTPTGEPAVFVPNEQPVVVFRNVNSNKCVDVVEADTRDGAGVQQYDCLDVPQQRFAVLQPDERFTQLHPRHAVMPCLDIRDGGIADGTPLQQWTCATHDLAQRFALVPQSEPNMVALIPQKAYESNVLRPKCVDVRDRSTANNAIVQQWSCATVNGETPDVGPDQQFRVVKIG